MGMNMDMDTTILLLTRTKWKKSTSGDRLNVQVGTLTTHSLTLMVISLNTTTFIIPSGIFHLTILVVRVSIHTRQDLTLTSSRTLP